jgi:hypothetical protein
MSTPLQAKALLSEVVTRGARKRIAQHLGIAESDLSRRFSVNDDRKSGIGEALREVSAIAAEDSQAFPKVKAFIHSCLQALEPDKQLELPLPQLVCNFQKETFEAARAFTLDRPVNEQIREASEAIAALQNFIAVHVARKGNELAQPRRGQRLRKTG